VAGIKSFEKDLDLEKVRFERTRRLLNLSRDILKSIEEKTYGTL
jgi:hypothetical protein